MPGLFGKLTLGLCLVLTACAPAPPPPIEVTPIDITVNIEGNCRAFAFDLVLERWVGRTLETRDALVQVVESVPSGDADLDAQIATLEASYAAVQAQTAPDCAVQRHAYVLATVAWTLDAVRARQDGKALDTGTFDARIQRITDEVDYLLRTESDIRLRTTPEVTPEPD